MKYFYTVVFSLLASIYTYQLAEGVLEEYLTYKDLLEYDVHNLDIIAVMFGSTNIELYPFLPIQSYVVLFPTFAFYLIGILLAIWRFIIIERGYHSFLLSRLQTKHAFIHYLQQGVYKKIIIYTVSYSCFTLIFAQFFAPYPKESINVNSLTMICLFTISRIMLLAVITQISFIVYLKNNAIIAQFSSLFFIVFCLIIGMRIDVLNFVFYNPTYFFLPSILLSVILYLGIVLIKKKLIYQLIEKE
ncbi:MAG: hypothetical protein RR651_00955 [Lysinibacillus sp.]